MIYAVNPLVQVGVPALSRAAPGLDAALLFIVGWVGGDSGRHSPSRLCVCRGRKDRLPASADGCLFKTGHQEMNEPKTDSLKSGQRGGALIYVVDDEPMLLELASVILDPLGYTIETFRSAEAAFSAYRVAEPPPALVITDYAMHAMTGLDLVEACRQIRPGQKALMVSGTVGEDFFQQAPVKPDRFLAKPYQANQLIDAVAALLAN
jgi:CheY-like chemotaxis protein